MVELTDNVEILRNAVIDYRDRVVPDIWAERNALRDAGEGLYVALSRYLGRNYPCDNQPEIERAMVAWQDVRA
jgi:hypothetical protein